MTITNEEMRLIETLISKFNSLSPVIWNIALRQVWTDFWINAWWALIMCVFVIYTVIATKNALRRDKVKEKVKEYGYYSKPDFIEAHPVLFVFCIISGICIIPIGICLTSAVSLGLNPEYNAIMNIVHTVK